MKAPLAATVVLPAYGVQDAIASVVRDLAVAAYALRASGIELDVLLLDGGGHAEPAKEVTGELGVSLTAVPGPASGAGEAYLEVFRRVVEAGTADVVVTLDVERTPRPDGDPEPDRPPHEARQPRREWVPLHGGERQARAQPVTVDPRAVGEPRAPVGHGEPANLCTGNRLDRRTPSVSARRQTVASLGFLRPSGSLCGAGSMYAQ